jgi:cellulose biosynthesis protein BcsS
MYHARLCGGRLIWHALAAFIVVAAPCTPIHAGDGDLAQSEPQRPRFEFWAGALAYDHVWSLYTGSTVALFGAIQEDGARLRVVTGYGADSYLVGNARFSGATSFADALAGYHSQLGPLTLKVFAGLTAADRQIRPDDPTVRIHGPGLGGKVALEGWWNLSDRAWTAVDGSWASLYQSYAGRARLGWRFMPELSGGLEASAVGNLDCDIVRAGAFLRYELVSGEISVTGGVSNDRLHDGKVSFSAAASGATPFAMVSWSWLTRF